jgi:uncharacterized protein
MDPVVGVEQESRQAHPHVGLDTSTFFPHVTVTIDEDERIVCVTISEEGPYPTPQQLIEILHEKKITYWIDEKFIHRELARKVCNQILPVAYGRDAEVDIIIGENERKAYMVLKPAYGGRELTVDDAEKALASRGVVFGVDATAVERVVSDRQYNTKVLCAEAAEPVPGVDAEVHLNFRTQYEARPKQIDHDKVDLRELGCVATVTASRVIAWKSPPAPGQPGMTVTGKPVPAKPGKDVLLRVGKGAHLSEDGTQVIADIDGQPILKGKTISVEPCLEVPGDVDFSNGNLHFAGSLRIRGNVTGGFTVTATQNIEIDGFVESSLIEAGGNIVVKGGVQGRGAARIKAGGSVTMLFVEHAHVEAGKDIVVTEVLHSELSAGDTILVNLGKGQVCGGVLRAGSLVEVRLLGSELNVPTKVSVGYDPQLKKRLEGLKKEKSGLEEYLVKTEGGIATLEECRREGTFTSRRSEMYDRLLAVREQLLEQAEHVANELTEMEGTVKETAVPEIKVHDTAFPNVTIHIKDALQLIRDEWKYATFYETEGEIKVMPLG